MYTIWLVFYRLHLPEVWKWWGKLGHFIVMKENI